ncbi:MAG: hypothetical protein WAL45_13690 [Terracidiphilus sp.]
MVTYRNYITTVAENAMVAELGGVEIVFPLGPEPDMSWATCTVRKGLNAINTVYQCELKPGYGF